MGEQGVEEVIGSAVKQDSEKTGLWGKLLQQEVALADSIEAQIDRLPEWVPVVGSLLRYRLAEGRAGIVLQGIDPDTGAEISGVKERVQRAAAIWGRGLGHGVQAAAELLMVVGKGDSGQVGEAIKVIRAGKGAEAVVNGLPGFMRWVGGNLDNEHGSDMVNQAGEVVEGYVADEETQARMVETLESVPGWQRVEGELRGKLDEAAGRVDLTKKAMEQIGRVEQSGEH